VSAAVENTVIKQMLPLQKMPENKIAPIKTPQATLPLAASFSNKNLATFPRK
jgi:hypothetical protein